MSRIVHTLAPMILATITLVALAPQGAEAQERNRERAAVPGPRTLSVEIKAQIQAFYAAHPAPAAEALPPGIRWNLERGKTLPPGIAKKAVPQDLLAQVPVPEGFELVEVGLDVLLVEVATNVIHDVLRDIIIR